MKGMREFLSHNRAYIALSHASYRWMTRISPLWNSRRRFYKVFGFYPRLSRPMWWSEKLLWLKLNCYNGSPLVRRCANKYGVRSYVTEKGCPELLIDCLGLWENENRVPFADLPDAFVLKSTMGCGGHVFCRDKAALDIPAARRRLHASLNDRYYLDYGELQYAPGKDMRPEVIGERLVETGNGRMLSDFKLFCFHGEPSFLLYCYDRDETGHAKYMFFDRDWKPRPELHPCDALDDPPERPACVDDMLRYARILSAPFPFVRVDFYEERGVPRIGELTFTPSACLDAELTPLGQERLGALLDLSRVDPAGFRSIT